MIRRLATLAVLLLGLPGFVPAALACAVPVANTDCCPSGEPCHAERALVVMASDSASCCELLPVEQRTVAAAVPSLPAGGPAPAYEISTARATVFDSMTTAVAGSLDPDLQQTYLITGRLRL